MYGGDFWQGFKQGGITAAAEFLYNEQGGGRKPQKAGGEEWIIDAPLTEEIIGDSDTARITDIVVAGLQLAGGISLLGVAGVCAIFGPPTVGISIPAAYGAGITGTALMINGTERLYNALEKYKSDQEFNSKIKK